jgi:hypothetical protein
MPDTFFNLTPYQEECLKQDSCPDCLSKSLLDGQTEGCAVNVICQNCASIFNIPIFGNGPAQRIQYTTEDQKAKTLQDFKDAPFRGDHFWIGP